MTTAEVAAASALSAHVLAMMEVRETQALAAWGAARLGQLCQAESTRVLRVFPVEAARQRDTQGAFAVTDMPLGAIPSQSAVEEDPPLGQALRSRHVTYDAAGSGKRVLVPLCAADEPRHVIELRGAGSASLGCPVASGLIAVMTGFYDLLADAETDPLTKLAHRRLFYSQIGAAMAPRSPDGARRFLAMTDIDHFKQVNDRFGHLYGDEILIHFAGLMRRTFRAGDLLFRFGGEEFVIVYAARGAEEGRVPLERFRAAVEGYAFPRIGRITASIGFASISEAPVPATTLIDRADHAVYFAKRNGRNQVCDYDALLASGALNAPDQASGGDATLF